MDARPVLEDGDLRLRPVGHDDLPAVLRVLRDPSVARWWGCYDEHRVRQEYRDDADADGAAFLVEVAGKLAGLIQFSEELDPDYRHAALDIALLAEFQGHGLGPRAIRLLARYLFEARGHHRLTIDPAADNRNAIRAYEKVGFRPVGVMRQYERGPGGTWHDGLLMDLLAAELA